MEEFEDEDFGKYEAKNFVEQAALISLARINYIEKKLASLHFAMGSGSRRGYQGEAMPDCSGLRSHLYQELNDAYKNMFMFALVGNNKAIEKKALKMASDRYLREGIHIMSFLDIFNGMNGYSTMEESEFRADIAEALIEKGLDPVAQVTGCPSCHAHRGQSCRNNKMQKVSSHKPRQLAALNVSVNPKEE